MENPKQRMPSFPILWGISTALAIAVLMVGVTGKYIGWSNQNQLFDLFAETQKKDRVVDWGKTDPMSFLQILQEWPGSCVVISNNPPKGWVKPSDQAKLRELVQSSVRCAAISHPIVCFHPRQPTTVGCVARFILNYEEKGPDEESFCFRGDVDLGKIIQPPHALGLDQHCPSVGSQVDRCWPRR